MFFLYKNNVILSILYDIDIKDITWVRPERSVCTFVSLVRSKRLYKTGKSRESIRNWIYAIFSDTHFSLKGWHLLLFRTFFLSLSCSPRKEGNNPNSIFVTYSVTLISDPVVVFTKRGRACVSCLFSFWHEKETEKGSKQDGLLVLPCAMFCLLWKFSLSMDDGSNIYVGFCVSYEAIFFH